MGATAVTRWQEVKISYDGIEESYQLSFKIFTPESYSGSIKLDKISFGSGLC